MLLTNKELSKRFNVDLAKWKRWSREFLPPDPRAGMQQGVSREYSLEDAFTVYLGGYLIATVKLSAAESRKVISDLVPSYLETLKIFPLSIFREGHQTIAVSWDVEILRWKRRFVYTVRCLVEALHSNSADTGRDLLRELGFDLETEQDYPPVIIEKYIPLHKGPPGAEYDRNKFVGFLPLTLLAARFLKALE